MAALTQDIDLAVATALHWHVSAGLSREPAGSSRRAWTRIASQLAAELERLGRAAPAGGLVGEAVHSTPSRPRRCARCCWRWPPIRAWWSRVWPSSWCGCATRVSWNRRSSNAWRCETREMLAPLANRLGVWNLKWELEDLAFRYLEPDDYHHIAHALAERRVDRERYIVECARCSSASCTGPASGRAVYGRPKHIYSIARKMQRKHVGFEQLFDVRAVRIVVESIADCYAALGVVHGLWHYIPGEFDDYIATPKDNEYRSIHTAVIGPEGKSLEVQIRSRDMHEHAELGVAAHWRYKEGGARDADYERKIDWVRRVLDPTQAAAWKAI